jgi:hypothetical protein
MANKQGCQHYLTTPTVILVEKRFIFYWGWLAVTSYVVFSFLSEDIKRYLTNQQCCTFLHWVADSELEESVEHCLLSSILVSQKKWVSKKVS